MSTFRRLLNLVKPHAWRLFLAMVCMALVAACTSAVAYLLKPLLDDVFIKADANKLNILPPLVLGVYVLKGIFFFCQSYLMNYVGMNIVNDLRVSLFSHMHNLSLSFFHKHPSGILISRITNDVNLIKGAVTNVVTGAVQDVFTVIGLVGVIFYRDWKLAIIGLFVVPLALYPIYYFGRKLRSLAVDGQVIMGGMTNILNENFQGIRIIKAFNMEDYERERFTRECRKSVDNEMHSVTMRSISSPLMESLGGFCVAAIIWYGGYSVIRGESTPGSFISFMTALLLLYEPIKRLARMNSVIQTGVAAGDRVFEVLDTLPEIVDQPEAKELSPIKNNLEFRDVRFGYDDEEVLKGIRLKVEAGEAIAIVGTSGGGKTTMVNLIPRYYDVIDGAILIDGTDIREVTMRSLRNQIAVVSQNVILFNDTVRHNIAYGRLDASEEDILAAAKAAYAHDFIMAMPQGYDTIIGERGVRLSGGERQRLAMARALLKNAPILILDEATSSLDTESELAVQRALENLMRGRTTFVIAHRLSTVRNADRIIVMSSGRIVEEGNHDQLMAIDGEYKRLHDIQFQVDDGLSTLTSSDAA